MQQATSILIARFPMVEVSALTVRPLSIHHVRCNSHCVPLSNSSPGKSDPACTTPGSECLTNNAPETLLMNGRRSIVLCVIALAMGLQTSAYSQPTPNKAIHINQIQVIGSHNSYHAGIAPSESKLFKEKNPKLYQAFEYRHRPLDQQLNSGIRQIELDIYADTKGGLYAHPNGPTNVAAAGLPADPDFDPQGLMSKPGFKVMHVQDFDYRSTCQPFIGCLEQIKEWSHAHPNHVPIFVLVETKQDKPGRENKLHLTETEPFTSATFDALDAEIRSVFPARELITPDDVRGHYKTLNQAVLAGNWPTLAKARGKVVFLMDQHAVTPGYLEGPPGLRARVIFTNSDPGQPDAAFLERNDGPASDISAFVRQGYLIRARTDSDTKEA